MPVQARIIKGRLFADVLAALHAAGYPPEARWDAAFMARLLEMPGCFACVAEVFGSAPCGMAVLRIAADEVEILTIAVLPEQRGQGVGAVLLETGLREAARCGAVRAFLEVSTKNAPALALYRRHGFGEIGRRKAYYPDGADALVMQCALSPADRLTCPCV